eukprot:PhF_6_TR33844/c0_g1_i1/m.49635
MSATLRDLSPNDKMNVARVMLDLTSATQRIAQLESDYNRVCTENETLRSQLRQAEEIHKRELYDAINSMKSLCRECSASAKQYHDSYVKVMKERDEVSLLHQESMQRVSQLEQQVLCLQQQESLNRKEAIVCRREDLLLMTCEVATQTSPLLQDVILFHPVEQPALCYEIAVQTQCHPPPTLEMSITDTSMRENDLELTSDWELVSAMCSKAFASVHR